tara:strand:- start:1144 stop:2649 length:1506 start_codon:yes stop_codon:yes gene_type:complete
MDSNYFMGLDGFVWFTGVVEDRNDPSQLGRVKVRCLGYHTEDLNDIPTEDLPWAHVMHPVTDPSMQGMGSSPSFLLEGSWVVGFFRDAREKQQPVVMGSLPGVPTSTPDSSKGFNDPNAIYPNSSLPKSGHTTGESDTNRLARGGEDAETHQSLITRRKIKVDPIPIATKPNIGTVSDTLKTTETRTTWAEPDPQGVDISVSQYPKNHVFESESGHIFEVDDTPKAERLYREHTKGTFEEIHPDGSRVVKVVGDDYEIIAGNKKVYINASGAAAGLDLTVRGKVNQYITGDYVLEVGGDFVRKIHGNERVKIGAGSGGGNLEEEIRGNHSFNIANSVKGAVGTTSSGTSKDYDITIAGNETRTVNGSQDTFVTSDIFVTSTTASITSFAATGNSITAGASIDVQSGGTTNLGSSGAVTTSYESSHTETVSGAVVESYGSLATSISGTTSINHTGIATYQYKDAFKERIEKDHFVTKITGFTDHTATVDPARATGTTVVTAI